MYVLRFTLRPYLFVIALEVSVLPLRAEKYRSDICACFKDVILHQTTFVQVLMTSSCTRRH